MIELFSIYAGLVSLLQRIFLARIMRKDHNEYVFYDCKALKLIQAHYQSVLNLHLSQPLGLRTVHIVLPTLRLTSKSEAHLHSNVLTKSVNDVRMEFLCFYFFHALYPISNAISSHFQ